MTERDDSPMDLGRYVMSLKEPALREVAANACGCSIAEVRPDVEPLADSTYGCFTGDKVELRLSYETTDGGSGETEVYVKRQLTYPGHKETEHYQYLNNSGMPVPRFYSSHLDEQQLEVLFLENATPQRHGDSGTGTGPSSGTAAARGHSGTGAARGQAPEREAVVEGVSSGTGTGPRERSRG